MIQDLSKTLKAILTQPGLPPELAAAQIVFDQPSEMFHPNQTTLNVFLYDLREDLDLRNNEPLVTRGNGQATTTPPPLRLACTYLVTAWAVGGTEPALQEHQLLSEVLQVLSRYPTVPPSFLQGSLAGQAPPLPMIALHPDALKNISEFWTSLGNRLRPSLSVTITIAMPVLAPVTGPAVITSQTGLQILDAPITRTASYVIAGTVTDAGNNPVPQATVTLVEIGLAAATGADGRYHVGSLPAGTYTLQAAAGQKTQSKKVSVPAPKGSTYDLQLA